MSMLRRRRRFCVFQNLRKTLRQVIVSPCSGMNSAVNPLAPPSPPAATALRIASVSYLNAKPLLWGVESFDDVRLQLDVPAKLLDRVRFNEADIALLPVIDYQRLDDLVIVPSGGIGSDGPTLTVRIFSKTPIEQIRTLACDTDSHTSVALAQIVLAERFRIQPELCAPVRGLEVTDACLLIGDKVVCEEPTGFAHQLDLGEAWKQLTGLPFVFAVWMTRKGINLRDLPARLSEARVEGLKHVDELVERFAIPRGWPGDVARRYLSVNLQYEIGERQLAAIRRFHQLAHRHGIIAQCRELQLPG
jgi:chorismate dehydratase